MSYHGYDDFIKDVKDEMINKRLFSDDMTDDDIRKYVLIKGSQHISRLGLLTFQEAEFIIKAYQDGYSKIRNSWFDKETFNKLTEIYLLTDHVNYHLVNFNNVDPEFIKGKESIIKHLAECGKAEILAKVLSSTLSLEHCKELLKSNSLSEVMKLTDPENHYELVEYAYQNLSTHTYNNFIPAHYITDEIFNRILEIDQDTAIRLSPYYYEKLSANVVFKSILLCPENLNQNDCVFKLFKEIFDETNRHFTREYNIMRSLTEFNYVNFECKEFEKAFRSLDIDTLYIAYNDYRVQRTTEEYYKDEEE